jgi:putative hemolysin
MPADEMAATLGVTIEKDPDFQTAAGFALSVLTHLPEIGEQFDYDGWCFEIVDMDGKKIDKLLASPATEPAEPEA